MGLASLRQRYSLFALVVLAAAPVLGVGVYFVEQLPVIGDPAAVLRMPIPGAQRVQLAAGRYGVYYGAPGRLLFGAPALDIDVVPPDEVPDPRLEPSGRAGQKRLADGTAFVELGALEITVAGRYIARVRGGKAGGWFAIGDLPVDPPRGPAILHGLEIFLGELAFAALLAWLHVRSRRQRSP